MFRNTYQNGLLSIFYSCGANPLAIWDMEVKNGHIKRLTDDEVNSMVLEICSTNVATTYITCPKDNQVLGIKLPFLVMIVKNLKRYFSFEITVLDDKKLRRRFRISNFQSTTKIKPFCTSMPIGLAGGWNQIQFNLADFTRRAYGTQLIETLRVQIHANARIRRIYFSERLYSEEELPQDYKLYLPLDRKSKKGKDKGKKEEGTGKKEEETGKKEEEKQPVSVGEETTPPPLGAKSDTSRKLAKKTKSTESSKKIKEVGEEEAAPEGEAAAGEETAEPAAEGEARAEGEAPAEDEAPAEVEAPAADEAPVAEVPTESAEPEGATEDAQPAEAEAEDAA